MGNSHGLMKEWEGLKRLGCTSYEMRSQSQWMKWHESLMWGYAGARQRALRQDWRRYLTCARKINIFARLRTVATEQGRRVLDTEVWLTFMRSRQLMGDIFQLYGMLICKADSPESQSNMNGKFREYLRRTGSCHLVIRGTILCQIWELERRAVDCGLRMYCYYLG